MLAMLPAILQILVQLLPEIISLAKSFKDTPQEIRLKRLNEVRSAMNEAMKKIGNTKPIEDQING